MLSNVSYNGEVFSKLTLPKYIEIFLEEYLQRINFFDKIYKRKCNFIHYTLLCDTFNPSQVFFQNFGHCKSILTMKNVSKENLQ